MRLFLWLLLISGTISSQIPTELQNIDPSNVSNEQLKSLGLSQADINSSLESVGTKAPETVKKVEVIQPKVATETFVKPKSSNQVHKNQNLTFGKSYFDNGKISIYEKASHLKAPKNYILGSGDEISVSIWGFSEHEGIYTINNNGSISPELVGKIYLKGMEYGKAKSLIQSRFGKVYNLKNSQITIELNYSKVIRVNIVGEVKNPGTYSVHAINSAFNILSLAGGINNLGSVRNVSVKRSGKIIKELDLYDFLANQNSNQNFFLLDNDYLVVNPIKKIVTIAGEVRRPMKYELKENENIIDLIQFAGGLLPNAYKKIVTIERIIDNEIKLIEIDFLNLKGETNPVKLLPGDRVIINRIPKTLRKYVSISGEIHIPGKYPLGDSLNLKELILKANGLTKEANYERAYILRYNDSLKFDRISVNLNHVLKGELKIQLKEFDRISVFSKKDFIDDFLIEVKGAVRKEKKFIYSEGMTLKDALFLSGGLKLEAASKRIEISRIYNFEEAAENNNGTRTIVKTIDLSNDSDLKEKGSFKLKPLDIIFVRSISGFEVQSNIIIKGEVNYPGAYSLLTKNETLLDLLERAGGTTDWAFLEGATLIRVEGNVGNLVLDLKKLLSGDNEYNYVLLNGDILNIPKINNYVSISGEIEHPYAGKNGAVNAPFVKGKSTKYFVKEYCGGFKKKALKKKLYIESPGGQLKKTKTYFFFIKNYPTVSVGDKIVVPPSVKKTKNKGEPINWNKIIEGTTVKLTGILTIWVLANTALK